MKRFCATLAAFRQGESGATAIEYSLIAAFIALAVIAGATQIGTTVIGIFADVSAGFP